MFVCISFIELYDPQQNVVHELTKVSDLVRPKKSVATRAEYS